MFLSREIRFSLARHGRFSDRRSANTWAGWPFSDSLVPHLALRCVLRGKPDPITGYLCNIKVIDDALQAVVTEQLIPAYWEASDGLEIREALKLIFSKLNEKWHEQSQAQGEIDALELDCSPYSKFVILKEAPEMVWLTQQFEFSAAHRLHCRELSDEQNRAVFGKCNHPSGHGHNYVVEVTVGVSQLINPYEHLQATVKRAIIDRLDHKHLNEDVDWFRDLNPSVENIAKQIFACLMSELNPMPLKTVRVYETPKTWAECNSVES